jgi:hypothetical protein
VGDWGLVNAVPCPDSLASNGSSLGVLLAG